MFKGSVILYFKTVFVLIFITEQNLQYLRILKKIIFIALFILPME